MRAPVRRLVALLAGFALSCGAAQSDTEASSCNADRDCSEGQVCFPDGCGDPGADIAIEVVPNAAKGLHAQDFQVFDLKATQNLEVFGAAKLQGEIRRVPPSAPSNDPALAEPYSGDVRFQISGASAVIPGVIRRYDARVTPNLGVYSLPVGAGIYQVTAAPDDLAIPPVVLQDRNIAAGEATRFDVLLAGAGTLVRVDGRLTRTAGAPFTSAKLQIQTMDELTQLPLSQRVEVSSGSSTSNGDFYLFLDPSVKKAGRFVLLASPVEAVDTVPQKIFTAKVGEPLPELTFGDYGSLVNVTGRLITAGGQPVEGATVYLEGKLEGGATFRSAATTTVVCNPAPCVEAGRFVVKTFPSLADSASMLVAAPPSTSVAGILRKAVTVTTLGAELGDVASPKKITVNGTLLRPDGTAAAGVRVIAEPLEAVENAALPGGRTEATTGAQGDYALNLDPARYRIDFVPGADLPRVSRFIIVRAEQRVGIAPESKQRLDLPPFALSKGRTVAGTISSRENGRAAAAAPYASVRFFRVVTVEGQPSSVLLAESIADAVGGYSVTLPTR